MKLEEHKSKVKRLVFLVDGLTLIVFLTISILSIFLFPSFYILLIGAVVAFLIFGGMQFYAYKMNSKIETDSKNVMKAIQNEFLSIQRSEEIGEQKFLLEEHQKLFDLGRETSALYKGRDYQQKDLSSMDIEYQYAKDDLVTMETFHAILKKALTISGLYRLGVFLIRLSEDQNRFSEKAFEELKQSILEVYHPSVIALYDDRTYAIYRPFLSSSSIILERAHLITKEFHHLDVNEQDNIIIYYAKIGIALYPYVSSENLVTYAKKALDETESVRLFIPNYSHDFLENLQSISSNERQRRAVSALESLHNRLEGMSSPEHIRDTIQHTIMEITTMFGFEDGGYLLYSPAEKAYHCVFEFSNNTENISFRQKEKYDKKELEPYDQMFDRDDSFYGVNGDDFPFMVRNLFDNFNIKYFYHARIKYLQDTLGYIFFNGYDHIPTMMTLQDKQSLYTITNILASMICSYQNIEEQQRTDSILSSTLRREQKTCYMVHEKDYRLTYVSQNLQTIYPNAKKGNICYKVFGGEEQNEPCLHCPLKEGRCAMDRPGLGEEIVGSVLTRFHLKDMEACILLESVIPLDRQIQSKELSPVLQIFNRLRLIRDLTEEVKEKTGYVFFFHISNYGDIVKNCTKIAAERQLLNIVKVLQSYGYESNIYHYHEATFALLFSSYTRKNVLDEAEKIFGILQEIPREEIGNKELEYHSFLLSYPSDFLGESITSVIEKNLKDCLGIEKSRLYLPGSKDAYRSLDRKTYVLECIDEAILKDGFEIYLQPIVSSKDETPAGAEILLRLNDSMRGFISPREFVPLASENGKMFQIEQSLIASLGELWRTYGFNIFSSRGVNHISVNISKDSALHPDFYNKTATLVRRYKFPKGFLRFEFQASLLKTEFNVLNPLIDQLKCLGISIAMDAFNLENDMNEILTQLPLDEVKLGHDCIKDFTNGTRSKESFTYIEQIGAKKGFTLTAEGVESKEQVEILKEMNILLYQGFYFAKPMSKDEYIQYLNFNK